MTSVQKKIVALVLVVALAATGGLLTLAMTSGDEEPDRGADASAAPSPSAVPDAGATDPPEEALAPFYSQELDWQECGDNECSTLEVPLDYAEPTGETIELAVLRVPAKQPEKRVGSLLVNPGGPGVPGTSYAARAPLSFGAPLLRTYDIVGFDPRGTGSSAPVDCLSDEQLDEYIATDPEPDTAAERERYAELVELIGDGCAERTPDVSSHVTTIEAARDMDVLRAALGQGEMAYFGASYGTKLGATYAELFPDRVGRLVLDGAVDLQLDARELNLEQAEGFERALRSYAEDCVEGGDCPLGDSVEAVLQTFTVLVEEIDREPMRTDSDRDLQAGNAFYGIVAPLYNEDYWFLLTRAMEQALKGDGSGLLELNDLYHSRGANGYQDNSSEAIYAINCLDDPTHIEPGEVPGQFEDFEEASPTFGRVFAWSLTGCAGLEVEPSVEPLEVDAEGADPILVIGTTRDPATPYEWAESLAEQLDSGLLVTRDGDGHTGYNAGNACVDTAVEDFLIEGTVPEDGLTC